MHKVCTACMRTGHLAHACPEHHWSYPKAARLESEPYLRLVATLPCAHCYLLGATQAAHENEGKGAGVKVGDDRSFPMCHEGGNGCHTAFDHYRLIEGGREAHRELGRVYVARTQATLRTLAVYDASAREIVEKVIGL